MKKVKIILEQKEFETNLGDKLSDTIVNCGIDFHMPCSGIGKCGKCKVIVQGDVSVISKEEENLLSVNEIREGVRLACCTYVKGDNVQVTKIVNKTEHLKISTGIKKIIPTNSLFAQYGVSIDIGTTTLVAKLFDKNGEVAVQTRKNSQRVVGSDVISRIEYSLNNGGEKLKNFIVKDLNELIQSLVENSHIKTSEIDYMVIAANTTMLYLLTNRNPKSLSCLPFSADFLYGNTVSAQSLGLSKLNCCVYLTKCISAFVGGDVACSILSSDMMNKGKNSILIDIGTNGEMALFDNKTLICCSTAAGPAFEGAELTSGMSGMAGAIDKVYLTGDTIEYTVIGGVNPQGICGSGIIDLISVLLIIGAIDETGRFEENILLKYNVLGNYNGHSACKLANEIYITQEDIRKIQLAKSAISSGILTLASRIDTTVEKLYVAGGFGSFLDLDSAINIGLIPAQFRDKTEIIGNAALDGASRILCNEKEKYNISNITQNVKAIDLSQSKTFMQYYIENMLFG